MQFVIESMVNTLFFIIKNTFVCNRQAIWILDEFASNLDDSTALSVGRNFARAARRRNVICIIASVRRSPLLNALTPDIIIQLNQVGRAFVTREWETLGGTHRGS